MNKVLPLIVFSLFSFSFPIILGEPVLELELSPEPIFNQVWADETYLVNVTIHNYTITNLDFTGYDSIPYQIFFENTITLTGKGGYDFGNSTTGYSYNLDKHYLNQTASLETRSFEFNLTFQKDSFEYGMKPYETIEILVESDVYFIMDDDSKSPAIITKKIDLYLVDDIKSQYLMGKYNEMQEEIFSISSLPELDSLKRDQYLKYLKDMNNSLAHDNYVEALEIWERYDENNRIKLIKEFAYLVEVQCEKINKLESVEIELNLLKEELETLESDYELLDETYIALTNTYQKVNTELNSSKKNLSTSITIIFLTAIIFYFIGQHGIGR
jgi:hypothetical protein